MADDVRLIPRDKHENEGDRIVREVSNNFRRDLSKILGPNNRQSTISRLSDDDVIEGVAEAMYLQRLYATEITWAEISVKDKQFWRAKAKAALSAAKKVMEG